MADSVEAKIKGDNNITAGRDVVFKTQIPKALRFCEKDLITVVVTFAEKIKMFSSLSGIQSNLKYDSLPDFTKIEIEKKNSLNNLSDYYFDYIKENSLPYFSKIEQFFGDPRNISALESYENAKRELQHIVLSNHKKFGTLEEIIGELYQYLLSTGDEAILKNNNLTLVFLHLMYWRCDIGRKE